MLLHGVAIPRTHRILPASPTRCGEILRVEKHPGPDARIPILALGGEGTAVVDLG